MKNGRANTASSQRLAPFSAPGSKIGDTGARRMPQEALSALFAGAGQKLRDGLSSEAEVLLRDAIERFEHAPDDLANLKRLLSFTLETLGKYREALEILRPY